MNLQEIEDIIFHIEACPEEWDQAEWARETECGTAMCIAGHAVFRAGFRFYLNGLQTTNLCFSPDGQSYHISNLAQKLLDLSNVQASTLFSCINSLEDLKFIAKEWGNGNNVISTFDGNGNRVFVTPSATSTEKWSRAAANLVTP